MNLAAGPVLVRELIDSLRTRRAFLILLVFNASVGGVVILAWRWAEGQPLAVAQAGSRLFQVVAFAQVALVTLLAPAFSGGAITLERERGTLEMLRAAPISTGRLLAEKFLAAVSFFVILVITASPLTTLSIVLGGVDVFDVVGVLMTLLVLVGVCGIVGVAVSTAFLRTHAAVAVTYIITVPIGGGLGAALLAWGARGMAAAALAIGFVGSGIGLALWGLSRHLLDTREEEEVEPESTRDVAVYAGLLLDRRVFPDWLVWPARRNLPIPDSVNPVLEKDLRLEAPGRSGRMISILIQGGMYLSIPVLILPIFWGSGSRDSVVSPAQVLTYSLYLLAFALLISSAFSSTSFSSERERKTLDLLAATPLPPGRVVWAKAAAALRGSLGSGLLFSFPFAIFAGPQVFSTGGLGVVAAALRCAAILVVTAFAVTFSGIWSSLRARTSLRAMLTLYALVAFFAILPLVAFALIQPFTGLEYAEFRWIAVPSPVTALISASAIGGEKPAMADLDPDGSMPIWSLFLLFWGVITPLVAGGSFAAYGRHAQGGRARASPPRRPWRAETSP